MSHNTISNVFSFFFSVGILLFLVLLFWEKKKVWLLEKYPTALSQGEDAFLLVRSNHTTLKKAWSEVSLDWVVFARQNSLAAKSLLPELDLILCVSVYSTS